MVGKDYQTRIQIINRWAGANALVSFMESFTRQTRTVLEVQERIDECSERQDFDLARALLLYRYISKKTEVLA